MAYESNHFMFRSLTDVEEEAFRQYAREHKPNSREWPVTHPVCRDEWTKLGLGLDNGGDPA